MRRKRLHLYIQREKRKKSIFLLIIFLFILMLLVYNFLFGEMGYINYLKLKQNEKRLVKEINELTSQTQILRKEIELLRKEPSYTEKYAREKFGLVKPGEMVFQFQPSENER